MTCMVTLTSAPLTLVMDLLADFDERDYAAVVEAELFGTSSDEDTSDEEDEVWARVAVDREGSW
jgi:hypothetical protein